MKLIKCLQPASQQLGTWMNLKGTLSHLQITFAPPYISFPPNWTMIYSSSYIKPHVPSDCHLCRSFQTALFDTQFFPETTN